MKINKVTQSFAVADQLEVADIQGLKELSYELIINNRPDGEVTDQPFSGELQQESISCGIRYVYLPITTVEHGQNHIQEFSNELSKTSGPVLAFCRTGMRAAKLWALNESRNHPIDNILKMAKQAGYDLSQLRDQLSVEAAHKESK